MIAAAEMAPVGDSNCEAPVKKARAAAVSYTHLTLPTIHLV